MTKICKDMPKYTWGTRQMSAQLKSRGYHVGRRKARRYMNEMDIYPIYPINESFQTYATGQGMSLSAP